MKCDYLLGRKFDGDVYILASDVMEAIAELKEFAEDACLERDDNQTAIDELQAENAELKQKLESVQASMYCDVVDANMELKAKHVVDVYDDYSEHPCEESSQVYLKSEADKVIAELKEEVNNLLMQNGELCQALQVMYSAEEYTKLQDENAELKKKLDEKESWVKMLGEGEASLSLELEKTKQKLEDVQASMYADVVDANMKIRRLQRALYKACANWAHHRVFVRFNANEKAWENMERKCLDKMEEYK